MPHPTRMCSKCEVPEPPSGFIRPDCNICRDCNNAARRAKRNQLRQETPDLAKAIAAREQAVRNAWRAANPDRIQAYHVKYMSDPANRERRRAYRRAHYLDNRDATLATNRAWRLANKERMAAVARAYREEHPEISRRRDHNRRARLNAVPTVPFTEDQLAARLALFAFKCWMCGAPFEHIDHVKPICLGGPQMLANLRPACASCNRSKSGRWYGVNQLDRFRRAG